MATEDTRPSLEIPVKIGSTRKWISGVTEQTTSSDILQCVLQSAVTPGLVPGLSREEVGRQYALLEVWRGVASILSPAASIPAIWRAWGQEQPSVCFVVKRIRHPRPPPSTQGSRDGAGVNMLERARAEVAQQRPAPASTPARQERRLLRRNSSATRPRRPPDTLHPRHLAARSRAHEDTPRPPPRSRAPDTVAASARRLARRGEQLRAELGSAGGEGEAKLDPHDTSDSGIVTDDSEAREASTSTSHYEVPWLAPRQGEELARVTEAISGLQRLDNVNTRLESSGEQILALGLEHRLVAGAADCVEAARDTGLVLDTFAAEVARLRALNTGLLGEITTNRDTMQRLAASTARGGRQLRQLETEVSCAEAEAAQLEASLAQLQLVRLPPPLQLHCDNSDDVTNNVTNTSPQHVILSPSTLV